jgi:hypothetical protein
MLKADKIGDDKYIIIIVIHIILRLLSVMISSRTWGKQSQLIIPK